MVKQNNGDWKAAFLAAFARTGNVSTAAKAAGRNRTYIYEARKADANFAAQWEEAREDAADALELEARRRAVEGFERPVFYRGEPCGAIREYSDTLLIVLLKAARPHVYRDNVGVQVGGDPGNPVKHDHVVTVTDRIAELAAAFEGAADRNEGLAPPEASSAKPA